MITIDFEFDSPYGKYTDAIVLLDGQTMTDVEIEVMKQSRYHKWLDTIINPPQRTVPVEPDVE